MTKSTLVRALTRTSLFARSFCASPPSDAPLKNVTKSNFEPALAELRRHVREADFVSIDLEMTGLTSAPWRECFEFDRTDVQYLKVKDSAEKFAVVQFGVCPFRWDRDADSFVAQPHNFYIFPRQEIPGDGSSYEFLCQTSSLEFLAKYQFNFNSCIYEGISYLSRSQEEEALRGLNSVNKDELSDSTSDAREAADTSLTRMADILFAERMKNRISEWRDGLLQNRKGGTDFQGNSNDINQKFQTTFFEMRPALSVNGLTSRQLKLIKLVTEKHFKDLVYVHVTGESSGLQPLIVYTDSTADRELLMREVKACRTREAELKINAGIGFRHVIDLLSSERKLIVGHNCFLDIAHIYRKFIGPLPSTAEEFGAAIQNHFPYIIDTKLLLNSNDVLFRTMKRGSTSLSKAFRLLCSQIAATSASSGLTNAPRLKVEVQVDNQRLFIPFSFGKLLLCSGSMGTNLTFELSVINTSHSPKGSSNKKCSSLFNQTSDLSNSVLWLVMLHLFSDLFHLHQGKNMSYAFTERFSNWNSGAKHEAGYDAFMTGSIFAQACCHLGIDFKSHAPPVDLLNHEKLQKYINHLYLSWVNGDIIDLKTGKSAAESLGSTTTRRDNLMITFSSMVLLWGLSPKLRVKDFRDCLLKVFGAGSVTSVYHLDGTAAFVQFSKAELVSKFLELKDNLERSNDPISILHPLSKLLKDGSIRAASYETYKEICSSPVSEVLFTNQAEAIRIQCRRRLAESAIAVERWEEYEMKSSSVLQQQERMDHESSCHFSGDELVDSSYPVEAQLSK